MQLFPFSSIILNDPNALSCYSGDFPSIQLKKRKKIIFMPHEQTLILNSHLQDASAHLSEETHDATRSAPIGVLTSIGVSAVFGFFFMLCLLFSIQDFQGTLTSAYGQPVVQIFVDVFGTSGAMAAMTLVILCVWHCGLFSLTSNSRMMFAFSRDGALPRFFDKVDARFKSPIRTIWLAATLAFILSLPSLGSLVAFYAATSIATIGLYLSYATPILIAVIWPNNFKRGVFKLGFMSRIIGIIACLWVCDTKCTALLLGNATKYS